MVSGANRFILAGGLAALVVATPWNVPARAAGLLPNGDFEAGSLIGWVASERRDGVVDVVTAGECFSPEDTTRITLFGNHAAVLRSGASGRRSSVGILTSDPFVAGDGLVFATLTGTRDGYRVVNPVQFEARILTAEGDTLTTEQFNTSVVRLREGCPGEPRDGRFYVHYFDTRKFLGQEIRIQFRQNTNTGGIQPFTLIDQVIRFERGEGPLFTSKPVAKAALSETTRGVLRLDGSGSFDPDEGPLALTYRWHIDGENQVRLGGFPCIDDLPDGTYEATLFVNDGFHAVSDSLLFEVTGSTADGELSGDDESDEIDEDGDGDDDAGDDAGDDPVPTVEIAGCDEEVIDTDHSVDSGARDDGAAGTDDAAAGDDATATGDEGDSLPEEPDSEDNTPPVVDLDEDDSSASGSNFAVEADEGDDGVPLADADLQILDADGDNIVRATVILQGQEPGDALVVDDDALPAGIDVSADDDSVSLFGMATAGEYELAIRAVTLDLAATGNATRTISVSVDDAGGQSNLAFTTVTVSTP